MATEGRPVGLAVVLVAPQIAGNTGNIIRLCANVGAELHLVEPLGFSLEDRLLRRAGLDYHDLTAVRQHTNWSALRAHMGTRPLVGFSSRATRRHTDVEYRSDHVLVFGAEQHGLTPEVMDDLAPEQLVRLPMRPNNRSMNVANACAVAVFEAWRQLGFEGAD